MLTMKIDGVGLYLDAVNATPALVEKATHRAINKTIRWAKVRIAREVASNLNIKVGHVKRALLVRSAHRKQLEAVLVLGEKSSIIKAIHTGAARQQKEGVRIRGRVYKGAFLAKMPGGHKGVFRRKGAARFPIQELFMFLDPKVREAIEAIGDPVRRYLERSFERELNYLRSQL